MKHYDVIVIGGGSAGICAAISAGRNGADVLLIERYGTLGGMATVGLTSHWDPIHIIGVRGLALEYYNAMKSTGHFLDFHFDDEPLNPMTHYWECGSSFDPEDYLDYSLKALHEAHVDLLLHTMVTGVQVDNGFIRHLSYFNTSPGSVSGSVYIDASGDGVVAYLAGAPYLKADKNELQSATLMFQIGGVRDEELFSYLENHPEDLGVHPRLGKMIRNPRKSTTISGFQSLIRKARENGDLHMNLPEHGIGFDRSWRAGEYRVNCTHTISLDCSIGSSLTDAQLTETAKTQELIRFFSRYIPGFQNVYLLRRAVQVGVRETRRFIGDYCLQLSDIADRVRFDDAVVEADWAHCDTHSPDGKAWNFTLYPGPYQIPYRCFTPKTLENLYTAGRCISCDRGAFSSVRIQMLTMTMGQAIGTAAAMAVNTSALRTRDVDVHALQSRLRTADYRI